MKMKLNKLSNILFSVLITIGVAAGFIIGVNLVGGERDGVFAAPKNSVLSSTNPTFILDSPGSAALYAPDSPTVAEPPIELDASAAAVYDLNGGEIWGWNDMKHWPMASLTKLMTAVVAKELIPDNDKIQVTVEAEQPLKDNQAMPIFRIGDTLTAKDMIKAMLLVSSNDAAEALAQHYGYDKFIQAMNAKAQELRMTDTIFVSPSGLSVKNLSTATDLEKLVKFIWMSNPDLFATSRKRWDYVTVTKDSSVSRRRLDNINTFAGEKNFLGGKTGQLAESGGNLISLFDINGPKLIIVLGAGDKFQETQKILNSL
jgi:D-alanyl-D-alanine endopeptidase (penicillin-binding protein 7)